MAATITITVAAANDPVDAVNDTAETDKNMALSSFDVLDNDDVPDGVQSVAIDSDTNGEAVLDGNNITFTPDEDFVGTAVVTYTVTDALGGSTDQATLTITVNDLP